MRNVGGMGESAFSLLCEDAGMFVNPSKVDKTGWDFLVEFPFDINTDEDVIHKAAFECRVQIKSTDSKKGSVAVSLSNLRRLATANMPAFFVIIEFDKKSSAQRIYVVHIDHFIVTSVLNKIHKLHQVEGCVGLNRRTMLIHYKDDDLVENIDGSSLKNAFLKHIGGDMSKYVEMKNNHLSTTGFENGHAHLSFTVKDEDNFLKLIDVSIGIENNAKIKSFVATKTRFGIKNKSPFVDAIDGTIEMPNIKPIRVGEICFREEKFGKNMSFVGKLYLSPFNNILPNELIKFRVSGEFFNLVCYPFTGKSEYSFSFGDGIKIDIFQFRDSLILIKHFCTPNKKIYCDLKFGNPFDLNFSFRSTGDNFLFHNELDKLNIACQIINLFDINSDINISLDEIARISDSIYNLYNIITANKNFYKIEFDIEYNSENSEFDINKETACIFLMHSIIGDYIFGIFLVVCGKIIIDKEINKYVIVSSVCNVEKKIVVPKSQIVSREEMLAEIASIEEKYSKYQLVVIDR